MEIDLQNFAGDRANHSLWFALMEIGLYGKHGPMTELWGR